MLYKEQVREANFTFRIFKICQVTT